MIVVPALVYRQPGVDVCIGSPATVGVLSISIQDLVTLLHRVEDLLVWSRETESKFCLCCSSHSIVDSVSGISINGDLQVEQSMRYCIGMVQARKERTEMNLHQ